MVVKPLFLNVEIILDLPAKVEKDLKCYNTVSSLKFTQSNLPTEPSPITARVQISDIETDYVLWVWILLDEQCYYTKMMMV